jgi:hypothetical protein
MDGGGPVQGKEPRDSLARVNPMGSADISPERMNAEALGAVVAGGDALPATLTAEAPSPGSRVADHPAGEPPSGVKTRLRFRFRFRQPL